MKINKITLHDIKMVTINIPPPLSSESGGVT